MAVPGSARAVGIGHGSAGVRLGRRDRPWPTRPSQPFPRCHLTFPATVSMRTWVPGQPQGPVVTSNNKRAPSLDLLRFSLRVQGRDGARPQLHGLRFLGRVSSFRSWVQPCDRQKSLCVCVCVLRKPRRVASRFSATLPRGWRSASGSASWDRVQGPPTPTRNRCGRLGFESVPVWCLSATRHQASATRRGRPRRCPHSVPCAA